MWIDHNSQLYEGDCSAGDRAATTQEILAWQLDQARQARLRDVGVTMARKMALGFAYGGKLYQIDDASQMRIAALALKAKRVVDGDAGATWDEDFVFIATDNSERPFSAAQFGQFADAASNVVIAWRMNARALKNAILAAGSAEAVESVNTDGGWV